MSKQPALTHPKAPLEPSANDGAPALATASQIGRMLLKHWPILVASSVLFTGASLLYAKSQPRVFQAQTMLEINPRPMQPLGEKTQGVLDLGAGLSWDNRDYYETQYKIITSDRVLGAVIRNPSEHLNLAARADFVGAVPPQIDPVEQATSVLRQRVVVEPVKYSRLVLIKVEDTNAERAKYISDAIADAYREKNLEGAKEASSQAFDWLKGQVGTVHSELERSENALHDFKQRHELPSTSINEASNMVRLEMQNHTETLSRVQSRKEEIQSRLRGLSKVSDNEPDELPASELLNNIYLQKLRADYQSSKKKYQDLVDRGKGEKHDDVKAAKGEYTDARKALLIEVRNIKGSVEQDLANVQKQESGESGLLSGARKRAVDLTMKEIEYRRLDRAREQNEKLYAFLLERLKEADLAKMMRVNNVEVIDYATVPRVAIRPRVSLSVLLGLFVGLAMGALLAWLREQLDRSLKTPDELEQILGVTFLGLLPHYDRDEDQKQRKGQPRRRAPLTAPPELIVHERPRSGVAEAARTVRTNLLFMNPDKPYQVMLVSSAAPSEGKTTIACSLAIALAQSGQRVCIIDCDLRRPRIHRIFGRQGDAGVTNVIVGDAALDEVARPTIIDNLWSIPAGPIPPNPADLLHSERFRKFLQDLRSRFDRVVIDSPPLVAVTDAAIISQQVDGCIFVIRAFKTDKHVARQGVRSLRDVGAPLAGAVLNAVSFGRHEYSHYYHYYAYRKEGYESVEQGDDASEGEQNAATTH